jgi:hypothetical protein
MFRKIDQGIKITAIRLYEHGLLPLPDILDCLEFSKCTWHRIYKLWNDTGDVINHSTGIRGCICTLNYDDVQYLLRLVNTNPNYFLDKLLYLLRTNWFISVHYATIHRELVRAGVSYKKLKKVVKERNENLCADFIARMAKYSPEELGFIDETSKDKRTPTRGRGRVMKGRCAQKKAKFVCSKRLSTEALLTLDGIAACTVVEGSMTKELFLNYLEFTVVRGTIITDSLYMMTGVFSCRNSLHIQDL